MKKQTVALYKALTGGEWLAASMNSVKNHVDGFVITVSQKPWLKGLRAEDNCSSVIQAFQEQNAGVPVHVIPGDWRTQEEQYAVGLRTVAAAFGEEARVLLADTDEVWEADQIDKLFAVADEAEKWTMIRTGLIAYVKSPLYQVWPFDGVLATVMLSDAKERECSGRFHPAATDRVLKCRDIRFHHYTYVRENVKSIRNKHLTTCSQDGDRVADWFERIWPAIPYAENIHPAWDSVKLWSGTRIIQEPNMPEATRTDSRVRGMVRTTKIEWEEMLRTIPHGGPFWECARGSAPGSYQDLTPEPMRTHEKKLQECAILSWCEMLLLFHEAAQVPEGGSILEVGAGKGGSAALFSMGSSASVRLTSVDPFLPYDEVTIKGKYTGATVATKEEYLKTVEAFGFQNRLTLHCQSAEDACASIPNVSQDLIFIDANHSYETTLADIRNYWPKLKPGGVLLGHDYASHFIGVVQAVADSGISYELVPGTTIYRMHKELTNE